MADAISACWGSKYRYIFWRPVSAMGDGAAPGDPDANWQPLLDSLTGTPAHPEYPSAHSTYRGAAAFILAAAFGENTAFSVASEIRSGTRSYASFSEAIAEIADGASLAAFTSEAVASRGTRWVEWSRIMYRDMRCGHQATIKTTIAISRNSIVPFCPGLHAWLQQDHEGAHVRGIFLFATLAIIALIRVAMALAGCGGSMPSPPPGTIPQLASLSPGSVILGGTSFTLTVNGLNFTSPARVPWNNQPVHTFVSSQQITASVSSSLTSK